ncbi:hypothetical protein IU500_13435 [Nocardia terpenica]|uniref:PPE domain-containing protein n=1 Tax=Nocardia terpenica TaxID=455432 RepID=UPI001893397F|nr:hypothetical protein [Nocardia terpenica]MBF6062820.1 hypothetical protein [Nocardia terpenica]MBF6105045.1 hypothetical protein [Nocardia terpenica]MBF6112518.1 hypothetical protein [Nocardia terpenica]MBF6118773.1 hypothetical protein [Nocardia terpenica]MBF6154242.1 hypothetical protein [Nocardia terpenica]
MGNDDPRSGPNPSQIPIIGGILAGGDPALDPKLAPKRQAADTFEQWAREGDGRVKGAGYDTDYVKHMEEFFHMKHPEIIASIKGMSPGVMLSASQAWKQIGDGILFNSAALSGKVHNSIAQGWEGATADALGQATRQYVNDLGDIHTVMNGVQLRIQSAAYGAETVKATVPPIPPPGPAALVPGADSPAQAVGQTAAESEAEQTAQWAMENHYRPTYLPAGQQIPTFTTPSQPGDGSAGPTAGTNSAGWSPQQPGGGTGSNASPDGRSVGADNTKDPGQKQADPTTTDPAAASANSPGGQENVAPGSSGPGATMPAGTEPAATTPASAGAGGGAYGGDPGRAGIATPGIGGLGGIGGGRSGSAGPGKSIPGGPLTGNPASSPLGGAGRPAATSGLPGSPGMGMPGGKGKGEEDRERKGRPELLVHERNKVDLVGEPIPAVPPAFGADAFDPPDGWAAEQKNPPPRQS